MKSSSLRFWHLADLPIDAKVSLAPGLILGVGLLLWLVSPAYAERRRVALAFATEHTFPYQREQETNDAVDAVQTAPQHTLCVAARESDETVRSLTEPVRQAITTPLRPASSCRTCCVYRKRGRHRDHATQHRKEKQTASGAILRHLLDEHPNVVFATTEREVGSEPVKKPCHDHVFRVCRSMSAA
jgi:hypothetical protein